MKLKLGISMKILETINKCLTLAIIQLSQNITMINKEMFDFSNYSTKSKYHNDSNKYVIGKMKDETAGFVIEEFAGLKPKMYSCLVDDNSKHNNY